MTDEDLAAMAVAIDYRIAKWAKEMEPFLKQMNNNLENHEERIKFLEFGTENKK